MRERERGGVETKSCPLLSCSQEEERKGVVGSSIISRYSVKGFVFTIRYRFLQRLLLYLVDSRFWRYCKKYIFKKIGTLSLFN